MKTRIVTLMMLSCFLWSGLSYAGEKEASSLTAFKTISSIIEKEIDYPAFASENQMECDVYVDLTIQKDGSIEVNASNSIEKSMKEYCVKSLEKLKNNELSNYAGEQVLLKINYQLIKQ